MDGASVRPATADDMQVVYALAHQLHPSVQVPEIAFSDAFSSLIKNNDHCCLVLEAGSGIVGYVSGYKHIALHVGRPVAYLDEIVVRESDRGNGGGRQLIASFEDWAESAGCALVGLATGGARGFYEGLGYQSKAGYYKKALNKQAT